MAYDVRKVEGSVSEFELYHLRPVEKVRQRRSRAFVVLTYSVYAAGAKTPAALLGGPFLNRPIACDDS